MGETDFHIAAILYLRQALRRFLREHVDVYVAADMLLYYEEGDPQAVRAPDVFVVRGVPRHDRRTYLLWEEGVVPCVVFEITSASSRLEDLGTKKALYEMLGVAEYIVFDPLEEYLEPQLQGFRLVEGCYEPMAVNPDGTLDSDQLGVLLRPEGPLLRVVDPATGDGVPTLDEAMDRADAAEAEAGRLRAELERLREGRTGD
jgi:hypothetical protein